MGLVVRQVGGGKGSAMPDGDDGGDCALMLAMLAIPCNRVIDSTIGILGPFTNMDIFGCIGLGVGGTELAAGDSQLTNPAPLPSRNKGDRKDITYMY